LQALRIIFDTYKAWFFIGLTTKPRQRKEKLFFKSMYHIIYMNIYMLYYTYLYIICSSKHYIIANCLYISELQNFACAKPSRESNKADRKKAKQNVVELIAYWFVIKGNPNHLIRFHFKID